MPSAPGVRRTRRASAERAGTLPSFAHVMPYTAEGETIAPAVLQGAEWKTIVSKRHEEFYQRERREAAERRALNALLQPTDSASSPADKAHNNGKYVISRKKTAERKKRPPIPRLPRDDRKIVVRPRNLNLRTIPPGILLATVCAQLNLPMPVIRNEDQLRINPYNNTFTISTPSDERAQLYLNLPGIRINDVDHPVMAYLPAPDNAVRGVIYGALGDESAEEIIEREPETPDSICEANGTIQGHGDHLCQHKAPKNRQIPVYALQLLSLQGESGNVLQLQKNRSSSRRLLSTPNAAVSPLRRRAPTTTGGRTPEL